MRALWQGVAIVGLGVGMLCISANATYFVGSFPATATAVAASPSVHLPQQRDIFRPPPPPSFLPELSARAAVITVDAADGPAPLLRYRANDSAPLASLTKLMSALVVLDQQPDWNTVVSVEPRDYRGGTRPRITPGDTLTIDALWRLMLVGSDNDAVATLVRVLGMSDDDFATAMNQRAAALGLVSTHFVEPTGLASGNVSTARELALLTQTAFAEPRIATILEMTKTEVIVSGVTKQVYSTDQEIKFFSSAEEHHWRFQTGKTGYIAESGYNVAFLAETATGQKFLTVLLGAQSVDKRALEAERLLGWAISADVPTSPSR